MKQASCAGLPTDLFFEDAWTRAKIPYTVALAKAREFCDTCPVRTACLAMECDYERGSTYQHRAGIFGGMTPQQRHSLERRGIPLACPFCHAKYDPVELRAGKMTCECSDLAAAVMTPIPNRGDQWTPRHTTLAQEVIAWLIEHVEADAEAPTAAKLARTMSIRVNDLRRVYEALIDDRILETEDGVLVRRGNYASTKGWVPPHLRVPLSHSE